MIAYPALRVGLVARRVNTAPVLFIGPSAAGQPWLEVIANPIGPGVADVFHAMMLRPGLIARLGLDSLVDPDYGPQRAWRRRRSNQHGQIPDHERRIRRDGRRL